MKDKLIQKLSKQLNKMKIDPKYKKVIMKLYDAMDTESLKKQFERMKKTFEEYEKKGNEILSKRCKK